MAAGPLMLDLEGPELTVGEHTLLRHPMVGGVILFARNLASPQQVRDLCEAVRQVRPELLLAVDQEGGRVQRLREGFTRFPPMARLGAFYRESSGEGAQLLRDAGWLLASEVLAAGLDFSFAPVLDVDDQHCQVIGDRAFSADPVVATAAARQFVAGMHEAGMAVTGKHFPGHGGVVADSHLETPVDPRELAVLEERDLVPFRELAGDLEGIMPAHIRFPAVDEPCVGFSRYWLQTILRDQLGFEGVIFSDDLSMKGADGVGGYPARAAAALDAGCDMILVCNCRPGALEVLEYLDNNPRTPSPRLAAMKPLCDRSPESLWQNERRRRTIAALASLNT